ncbi:MAG TPA: gephyrin-like molybdotransferase Glp [Acidobacteriaceae bacterium]|jgi:molybdopterin molybdotransferase|nr:gephyrin-like molybdotransferase Glp [Acidobacteriaceae bacterium]
MPETAPSVVLSYAEATNVVRAHAERVRGAARPAETVPLPKATGRVLAQAIAADRDQPPFPRATRDGFACRADDLTAGDVQVVGQLRAGEPWAHGDLERGEAIEIMTGAAVPPGADSVVMVEHVKVAEQRVSLNGGSGLKPGDNVVPAGAEAKAGDVVVPAGRRMGPAEVAAAAACGAVGVEVWARPRVAILATGDELVDIAQEPLACQIRNSNSYSLAAQIIAAGGIPQINAIVADDASATEQAIRDASGCDLVLLTGGVSMGKFDFVEQALLGLGAEFFFTGVRIQPGKPVVFGKLPGPYFLGLPGNPISTMVTFALFAGPLLRAIGGERSTEPRFVLARVEEEVRVKPGLTRFLPARMDGDVRGARVRWLPWQGSGDLTAAARANAFLVVPESADHVPAGGIASVLLL